MILYFLRHGNAEPAHRDGDEHRRLSPAGEAALHGARTSWRRLNLRPDVVLTSPLVRARRTAELACDALGGRPEVVERLAPGAEWADFAQAMATHPQARRVLFVGHEPDLSSVISLLSGARSVRVRPGGVACLEFPGIPEPGDGEIAWLLDPDLYADGDAGPVL